MRRFLLLLIFLLITIPFVSAQENLTPYEIALERIQQAERAHADYLALDGLGLDELPPEIASLTYLKVLILNDNNLTQLPPEIGQLNLTMLYFSHNQIVDLPHEISNLEGLCYVDGRYNQLEQFPPAFENHPMLANDNCRLNLVNNPYNTPDAQTLIHEIAIIGQDQIHDSADQALTLIVTDTEAEFQTSQALFWQTVIINVIAVLSLITLLLIGLTWRLRRHKTKRKYFIQ